MLLVEKLHTILNYTELLCQKLAIKNIEQQEIIEVRKNLDDFLYFKQILDNLSEQLCDAEPEKVVALLIQVHCTLLSMAEVINDIEDLAEKIVINSRPIYPDDE